MTLSAQQKDRLEDEALRAFGGAGGRVQPDLKHGFRVNASRGQVAAIYWSNNAPANEIEIAVCDSRLTDKYQLTLVHRWVAKEKAQAPSECNVHQNGSDWPILGFSYSKALEFLTRCRELRMGMLPPEVVRAFENATVTPGDQAAAVLASLRPAKRNAVIDLIYRAGISVSHWYVRKDNTPAVAPRSNPAYCYDWAFGGDTEPALACLWHGSLTIVDAEIVFAGNIRALAQRLEAVGHDAGRDSAERQRARQQAPRARALDKLLREVHRTANPLRVILNEGVIGSEERLGKDSSVVRVRTLDEVSWIARAYSDETGAVVLARKAGGVIGPQDKADPEAAEYVDQRSARVGESPAKVDVTGSVYLRDRAIRDAALRRASGHCEFCNAPGFKTAGGKLYLETHHVVPLSEGGHDEEWNIAALCANDHRETHYGERAANIRADLLTMLEEIYPRDPVKVVAHPSTSP